MTPIPTLRISCPATTLRRDLCTAITTAAMLFSWAFAAHNYAFATDTMPDDMAKIYRLLRAGCHFPSKPGEAATWAIGGDGALLCWEQRDKGENQ